ncbi:hypothetical protein CCO03_17855 [Comamonas serinivorans]|uniref:Cell surface protein n=1 Tax=Comamonas serinivorans TaxID=1082851 RepID=A0A1Y0ERR5_9BURK|nr:hypothetical protein [Comamonas serinivorans]ARU06293.1 hypothetical protein CCO03_17855 [Comamonas serinivorans]
MKKSILALSAAVAVSGLGFAGAANALAVFDVGSSTASEVQLAPSAVGHYLFTPYFTTQSQNNTLLSVVNTDTVNGKAVKVRFRGAANSDDILDFTLFLSPGDVWTASLKQGVNGLTEITSPDNSCTLPQDITNVPFRTGRLDQSLSDAALASHTREGYVEFLNMADVPPGSALYKNIKHVKGVAPCDLAAFADVLNTSVVTADEAREAGLDNPTDGLTGGWTILRLDNISTFSGTHTAVVATDGSLSSINGQPVSVAGNFAFSPQSDEPIGAAANVDNLSADPLLKGGAGAIIEPLWMDLPDMSTPLVNGYVADQQATDLSFVLAKAKVMNEFVSTLDGAVVPGDTDWVVSQPTRRYNVALDYNAASTAVARVFNPAITAYYTPGNTRVVDKGELGDLICLRGKFSGSDREEGGQDTSVSFSPAEAASAYCGEVFTLTFNRASSQVLSAALTNVPVALKINNAAPEAGWATFAPSSAPAGLPMTGFSAISLKDVANHGNYGYTYGHRW